MAGRAGHFILFISIATKAVALTYFSSTKTQVSFQEFFLPGKARLRGQLMLGRIGQPHCTIRQCRALILQQQTSDSPLAGQEGS